MKTGTRFTLLIITIFALTGQNAFSSGGGAKWGYHGEHSEKHWGNLSHDYKACSEGKEQSPINIVSNSTAGNTIKYHYKPETIIVLNNGHTIQANDPEGSYMETNGKKYHLLQFHFHSPSENKINGKAFDMVMHLVHKADDGELAVVAVMMEVGSKNSELQKVWNDMPSGSGDVISGTSVVDPNKILPSDKSFYRFRGSLTTPPCTEEVLWNVLASPISISAKQKEKFLSVIGKNIRSIQETNGRDITRN